MSSTPLPPYLSGLAFPLVFEKGLIQAKWDLNRLSISALIEAFDGVPQEFRLGQKRSRGVVWEGRLVGTSLLPPVLPCPLQR